MMAGSNLGYSGGRDEMMELVESDDDGDAGWHLMSGGPSGMDEGGQFDDELVQVADDFGPFVDEVNDTDFVNGDGNGFLESPLHGIINSGLGEATLNHNTAANATVSAVAVESNGEAKNTKVSKAVNGEAKLDLKLNSALTFEAKNDTGSPSRRTRRSSSLTLPPSQRKGLEELRKDVELIPKLPGTKSLAPSKIDEVNQSKINAQGLERSEWAGQLSTTAVELRGDSDYYGKGTSSLEFQLGKDVRRSESAAPSRQSIKAPELWKKAREHFLRKEPPIAEKKNRVSELWTAAIRGTVAHAKGIFGRRNKALDSSTHGLPVSYINDVGCQTDSFQQLTNLSPVLRLLREACEKTGFAYGEIWLRQHRHNIPDEHDENKMSAGLRRSIEMDRIRRKSFDMGQSKSMSSVFAKPFSRVPSGNASSHASSFSKRHDLEREMFDDADMAEERMARRLRWAAQTCIVPERFEEGESEGFVQEGWNEAIDAFKSQAEGRFAWYEKGKGFPGSAWARKELDWHDLAFLPEDDDLAADPRVLSAKALFDFSVGVPVLDPDSGHLIGVVMLYHIQNFKAHRPNQNWKRLSKNPQVVGTLIETGKLMFWSLMMHDSIEEWNSAVQEALPKEGLIKEASGHDINVEHLGFWTRCQHYWIKYFRKFKGQPNAQIPSGHTWQFSLWAGLGTFLGIFSITSIDQVYRTSENTAYTGTDPPRNPSNPAPFYLIVLINSMAAVTAMLFSAFTSPLIQPRNVIVGHAISATVAVCIDFLSNPRFTTDGAFCCQPHQGVELCCNTHGEAEGFVPRWITTPLAPALAIGIMAKIGLVHPPACAAAVIYLEGDHEIQNMGWLYIVQPVLFDCTILIIVAVIINNLSRERSYPLYW